MVFAAENGHVGFVVVAASYHYAGMKKRTWYGPRRDKTSGCRLDVPASLML